MGGIEESRKQHGVAVTGHVQISSLSSPFLHPLNEREFSWCYKRRGLPTATSVVGPLQHLQWGSIISIFIPLSCTAALPADAGHRHPIAWTIIVIDCVITTGKSLASNGNRLRIIPTVVIVMPAPDIHPLCYFTRNDGRILPPPRPPFYL